MTQNSGAPNPPERVRLDSWKEIAEYLGRDIRTVLRWEQERGLPVHTIPSGRRRSVYAYKDELDAWLAKGSRAEESVAPEASAGRAPVASPAARRRVARIPLPARVAGLVVLLVVLSLLAFKSVTSETVVQIDSVQMAANTLHALRDDGTVVWSYTFAGPVHKLNNSRIIAEADSGDPNACRVLVVTAVLASVNSPNLEPVDDKLFCFSSKGQQVWERSFKETLRFGSKEYGTFWGFRALHIFHESQQPRIAASLANFTWFPSLVLTFDLQGNRRHTFVNSGWVHQVLSIERPTGGYLLASGVSNSNDAGMMAVLDLRNPSGGSPEKPGSEFECQGCPEGRPVKYFVFPRSELNLVTGSKLNYAGAAILETGVELHTIEVELSSGGAVSAVYEFSPDVELRRASFDHRFWELHRRLELEGKLKHSEANCPERLGPQLVRVWDRATGWQEIRLNKAAVRN